ncbi:MAG TPA: alpha-ketoglutarate-dependent dioxygenase AlkB, partial [Fluviicoccus sp.]|nr:alpha-ketoglutarate-dependent dioxygenase AlkB [Fluviicoccus sp.]
MRQDSFLLQPEAVQPEVWLLPQFTSAAALWADLCAVAAAAPFRHMMTRMGHPVAAAMSNCGALGWTSSARGYAYRSVDPETGRPWPPIPAAWLALAREAAALAGYADYAPDACLVNRYAPGTGMGRHNDDSEQDFTQPIVSVSLGLP